MRSAFRPACKPLALAVALLGSVPAFALQFEIGQRGQGEASTRRFPTASRCAPARATRRSIGIANGGTSRSTNEDDGDLNFDKGKTVREPREGHDRTSR